MKTFLANIGNPTVAPDCANDLDTTLSLQQLHFSIRAMEFNKAPGPDGFPVELLKECIDKLAPLLLSVLNESLKNSLLPPTLTQASVALLLLLFSGFCLVLFLGNRMVLSRDIIFFLILIFF